MIKPIQNANPQDPTPNDFPDDYDRDEVDPRVRLRTNAVLDKMYGGQTRAAMAQAEEISSVHAKKAYDLSTNIEERFNNQIAGSDLDDETIDFRHSDMLGKSFITARKRGDFLDQAVRDHGVNVKWFSAAGDGVTDDTVSIQAAFDAAYNIYFPAGNYLVDATIGLKPHNNSVINLDDQALISVKPNAAGGYRLFDLENSSDITIIGGTLIGDAETHEGVTGQWGMGIHLENSKRISIRQMKINKFWGDGIYIGGVGYDKRCHDIKIDDVDFNANRRQGISVINVEGLQISKATITNTSGTGPAAGIDFEPNNNGEVLKAVDIGELITADNDHAAVLINLSALFDTTSANLYDADTSQVDIRINKISSRNDLYGLDLESAQISNYKVYGNILINELNIEDSDSNGIRNNNYKTMHTPHVRIGNAYIKNANGVNSFPNHPNGAAFYIRADANADGSSADNLVSYGNIDIDKLEVVDELDNTVRGMHFQVAGANDVINARIGKYITNQSLLKQSSIEKFTGTVGQINHLPEILSAATAIENLVCHDFIYNLKNTSITLPKALYSRGSTITIRNQNSVTEEKMANIKTTSDDLILIASEGVTNGSTTNVMLKSSNGFIKLACMGSNQWLVLDSGGYITYPALKAAVSTYYNATLPTNFSSGAQVGDRVINTIPRSGVPAQWVCTAAGNPGTWIGLNTLS